MANGQAQKLDASYHLLDDDPDIWVFVDYYSQLVTQLQLNKWISLLLILKNYLN